MFTPIWGRFPFLTLVSGVVFSWSFVPTFAIVSLLDKDFAGWKTYLKFWFKEESCKRDINKDLKLTEKDVSFYKNYQKNIAYLSVVLANWTAGWEGKVDGHEQQLVF